MQSFCNPENHTEVQDLEQIWSSSKVLCLFRYSGEHSVIYRKMLLILRQLLTRNYIPDKFLSAREYIFCGIDAFMLQWTPSGHDKASGNLL